MLSSSFLCSSQVLGSSARENLWFFAIGFLAFLIMSWLVLTLFHLVVCSNGCCALQSWTLFAVGPLIDQSVGGSTPSIRDDSVVAEQAADRGARAVGRAAAPLEQGVPSSLLSFFVA